MTTVTEDLVQGHRYSAVLGGFDITRVFRVSGLIEAPERQLIEAANDPGVPSLGDIYPGTTGIPVVEKNAAPAGPNAATVTCIYSARVNVSTYNQPFPVGNDGQDVKQISSGLRAVKTSLDRSGAPMIINPTPTTAGWKPYISEAEYFLPVGEIVFERVETTVAASRARGLVGYLNQLALSSYAAETLLFYNLDSNSEDGGTRWNCTYTFRYDSGGWQHVTSYHGPNGKVPDDAGVLSFDVIPIADFGPLGLDFSDSQTPIS